MNFLKVFSSIFALFNGPKPSDEEKMQQLMEKTAAEFQILQEQFAILKAENRKLELQITRSHSLQTELEKSAKNQFEKGNESAAKEILLELKELMRKHEGLLKAHEKSKEALRICKLKYETQEAQYKKFKFAHKQTSFDWHAAKMDGKTARSMKTDNKGSAWQQLERYSETTTKREVDNQIKFHSKSAAQYEQEADFNDLEDSDFISKKLEQFKKNG